MFQLAIVFAGDSHDPAVFSGIPYGIANALESKGVAVARINATATPPLTRVLNRLPILHPERCRLQSLIASRALAAADADGVLQIGSEYVIQTSVPTVTYDDMTVVQHVELDDDWFLGFPARSRDAWRRRQAESYQNADLCCVLSQWAGESIVAHYGVTPDRIRVVGLGGNHVLDGALPAKDWSRPRYLCLAVDWRRKNVPLTIAAFEIVRERFPGATLDIVGPYSGPAGAGVTLHGPISLRDPMGRRRVEGLFRASTCYVMPSRHEASALAFVEAGSAGLPSIGTTIGGVADLIGPGGVVVAPSDFEALVHAMSTFADPHTAQSVGQRAADHARWYTWDKVADRILSAFKELTPT